MKTKTLLAITALLMSSQASAADLLCEGSATSAAPIPGASEIVMTNRYRLVFSLAGATTSDVTIHGRLFVDSSYAGTSASSQLPAISLRTGKNSVLVRSKDDDAIEFEGKWVLGYNREKILRHAGSGEVIDLVLDASAMDPWFPQGAKAIHQATCMVF